jgi:hypothetical protein
LTEELTKVTIDSKNKDRSVIINLESVNDSTLDNAIFINNLHEMMYQQNLSFAVCCMQDELKKKLAIDDERINVTPKLIEAIDIVSMEGLERELMGDDVFDEGDDMDF